MLQLTAILNYPRRSERAAFEKLPKLRRASERASAVYRIKVPDNCALPREKERERERENAMAEREAEPRGDCARPLRIFYRAATLTADSERERKSKSERQRETD